MGGSLGKDVTTKTYNLMREHGKTFAIASKPPTLGLMIKRAVAMVVWFAAHQVTVKYEGKGVLAVSQKVGEEQGRGEIESVAFYGIRPSGLWRCEMLLNNTLKSVLQAMLLEAKVGGIPLNAVFYGLVDNITDTVVEQSLQFFFDWLDANDIFVGGKVANKIQHEADERDAAFDDDEAMEKEKEANDALNDLTIALGDFMRHVRMRRTM